MTADDQTRPATRLAPSLRRRSRSLVRRIARPFAGPYLRLRAREAETVASLGRVQSELEHIGGRHTEQIERLEDLARELIATAEALRRRISELELVAEKARGSTDDEEPVA